MRARDIMLFVICIGVAAPLITLTGIFSTGPAGVSTGEIMGYFAAGTIIAALAGGGVSIMGWSFKVPAVLTAYLAIYVGCTAMMTSLIAQIIQPWEVAAVFSTVFIALFAVVGVFGALEIAGGPHGPME